MRTLLVVSLILLAGGRAGADTEISWSLDAKPVGKAALSELKESLRIEEITVWEPHEKKEVRYKGFAAGAFLDKALGQEWKSRDQILFVCADGYKAPVPVSRFPLHEGYLVFERIGEPAFEITNTLQGNERVPLGPLYLVWNNVKEPKLKDEGAHGWPYQVVGVDAIKVDETKSKAFPPRGASPLARQGYQAFKANCITCHKVNGEGGDKSFDLNHPVSVTTYYKEDWLKKWILDPSAMRPGTTMPSLPPGQEGKHTAEAVVAYLKVMARNKR